MPETAGGSEGRCGPLADTSIAHVGRVYDFLLGGTTHYEVDRKAAEESLMDYPGGR